MIKNISIIFIFNCIVERQFNILKKKITWQKNRFKYNDLQRKFIKNKAFIAKIEIEWF